MAYALDQLVARLAQEPCDRSLDQLENELGRAVARRRADARASLAVAPFSIATIGLALVMGLTVGGATAARAPAPKGHGAAQFAPSTLLGE